RLSGFVEASASLAKSTGADGPPSDRLNPGSKPQLLIASMKPGYTVNPLPSMSKASAGGLTSAPTASIKPSRITTVAFGSTLPGSEITLASRIAKTVRSEEHTSEL